MTESVTAGTPSTDPADQPIVRCAIAHSSEPWKLGIDAIVLSVGTGLGRLAEAVRAQFPEAAWNAVHQADISPDRPYTLDLDATNSVTSLRVAIVTTPHEGSKNGAPSVRAARIATGYAIRSAMQSGVTALGLPLLGTGVDNLDTRQVAHAVVQEVVATLQAATGTALRELVFICKNRATEAEIRDAWGSRTGTPLRMAGPRPAASTFPLAGGMSDDLVDPTEDRPLSSDKLGVGTYVSMLATVIADERTPLPLSVGIFGEWGSGKSFFMGLLRHEVQRLAASKNTQYCHTIEQIRFNAWHYADSNLWASLGDEIFRQLAGADRPADEQRTELRTKLAERLVQHKELEAAAEHARAEVWELRNAVHKAMTDQEAEAKALLAALPKAMRKQLDSLWRRLGVTDIADQRQLLAEQISDGFNEARALRHATRDHTGKVVVAVSALLLGAVACVGVAWPTILATVGPGLTVVMGTGIAMVGRVRHGLRSLRELAEDLRAGRMAKVELTPKVVEKRAALLRAADKQRVAEARLADVVMEVGELDRRLAGLDPGKRLYTFLAERANGDAYSGKLGLISMIRKDFEQLVELMADLKKSKPSTQDGATRGTVDRIVLYIDDLDRCGPRQVVDVLQAVHLLLAMKLFVVVVGVDPRWLLRSLSSHYHELLDDDRPRPGDPWLVTPEDYLEKIFNIPFVLPGLSSGTLAGLLQSLVEGTETVTGTVPTPAQGQVAAATGTAPEQRDRTAVEPGSELSGQQRGVTDVPARPLTSPELTLLATMDSLIDTPREAKRLANIYRMVRATKDLSEAARFLGGGGHPGEYQAVVVLLGMLTAHGRLLAKVLDAPPDPNRDFSGGLLRRPARTPWTTFVADMAPRKSESGWTNRIVGAIDEADVPHWCRLHGGLLEMSNEITLEDISAVQSWVPTIRRFSYVR